MSKNLEYILNKHKCDMKKCEKEYNKIIQKELKYMKNKNFKDILETYQWKERKSYIKCQLKNCQKEFKTYLQSLFQDPIFHKKTLQNKKNNYFIFYSKYKHLIKKKIIEYNDIKTFDVEFLKITRL